MEASIEIVIEFYSFRENFWLNKFQLIEYRYYIIIFITEQTQFYRQHYE